MRWAVCLLVLLLLATATTNAAEFYASPSGSSTASGAIGSPWDLATALNAGYPANTVQPGDTIWLRNGTYTGAFTSNLNGTAASPIKVRQYAGERATLVGTMSGERTALYIHGGYTWFMDFEITAAGTDRISTQSTPWPTDIDYAGGVITGNFTGEGVGCKYINLIVHDTCQGLSMWMYATDMEVNGCIIYHNGWDAPDRGHGHGIYTQNNTGVKSFKNNIVWAGFSYGTQAYGSEVAYLNNFTFDGNTYFDAGIDSNVAGGGNLLVGGGSPCHNIVVTNNAFYRRGLGIGGGPGDAVILGYGATNVDGTLTDNYCAGAINFRHWQQLTVRRNTVVQDNKIAILDIRPLDPQPAYDWNDNTYYCLESAWRPFAYQTNAGYYDQSWVQWKAATGLDSTTSYTVALPTSVVAFVRPSAYDSARANITIFNWPQSNNVSVNVSSILTNGDTYEVRDAQNFYGTAVTTGIYGGGTISIPMTSTTAAQPTGNAPLTYTHTSKQFGAFVLIKTGGGGPPAAPTSLTATDGTYTTKVTVSWTASTGATSYKIFRNTTNNSGTATQIGTPTGVTYDDTTATAGTTYYYWAKATNAAGDSGYSNGDSGYRLAAPAAPTSLAATDGTYTTKVTVSWAASTGATSYKVFRNTVNNSGTATQIGTPTGTSYDDTTATAGTTYYYWAKATNAAGDSGYSNGDSGYRLAAPAAPTSLAATDGTYTTKVTVSWTASTGATSYKVYRNTTNNSGTATQIGTPTGTSYDDTTAAVGTTYYYWAKATNAAGDSGYSNSDTGYRATLPVPAFSILRQEGGSPEEILKVDAASGDVFAKGMFLANSLDLAENFDAAEPLEAGSVVVIDPTARARLALCRRAYDSSAAGIISCKPGLLLGKGLGIGSQGKAALALAGRTPCKVDASYGAISMGDLLTTSPTLGHAMKADPAQIVPGCIIGKALEPLETGAGTIKVMITLQ